MLRFYFSLFLGVCAYLNLNKIFNFSWCPQEIIHGRIVGFVIWTGPLQRRGLFYWRPVPQRGIIFI